MSLISDMNALRPLPTVAREARAFAANVAFALLVLGALWAFEVPLLLPSVVIGVLVALLGARLAFRAVRGDRGSDAA
ncbi:hypothetical protein [uncultured Nocardioides sp.]|uniref:hypothetical protein n=1 Tax=uncultured Nocardioides sp. TaxID=198441 RepID=UPI002617D47D|nr:hypothetical protein [uncultured Nocardioides sp.]